MKVCALELLGSSGPWGPRGLWLLGALGFWGFGAQGGFTLEPGLGPCACTLGDSGGHLGQGALGGMLWGPFGLWPFVL